MSRLAGARGFALQVAAVGLVGLGVVGGPPAVRWVGHLVAGKPVLKVDRLGPVAVGGVIAAGAIDGRHWQIRLRPGKSWEGTSQCAPAGHAATNCALGRVYLWAAQFPQRDEPAFLAVFDPQLVSQVRRT